MSYNPPFFFCRGEKVKTFYFKVDGRIDAENEDEATDYIWKLLTNKCGVFQIIKLEEVE